MMRALPLFAAAVLALSTAACSSMPWEHKGSTTGSSSATGQQTGAASSAAMSEQTALAPDMVRDIQRRLSQRGYNVGPADGVFGAETQSALRSFQKDQNIRANGQIDEQTLAALNIPGNAAASQQSQSGYTPTNRR
ncbi:MAG: peptidoglycan-binding domain-containing protein [Actinomycetota bacterium]